MTLCSGVKYALVADATVHVKIKQTELIARFPFSKKSQLPSLHCMVWSFMCNGRLIVLNAMFTSSPIDFSAKTVSGIPAIA